MKKSRFMKMLSLLLAIIMAVMSLPLNVFAEELQAEEDNLYIKELRVAQAETRAEAKADLEDDGFIFLEGNLNEGTGEDGIWLGYKTTTDPTEAIYDMKLMNTDGGFTLTSVEEAIKAQESMFAEMAADLEMLIDEFVEAYKLKLVPAQKAYKALNFFRMVEGESELEEENGLGYQLIHGGMTTERITEMIMLCDATVVDSIVKILTMGIQIKNDNWMEKLSKLGPYDEDVEYGKGADGKIRLSEDEIKRRASQLESAIKLYTDAYNAFDELGLVSGKLDENFNIKDANYKTPGELTADELAAKKADEGRYKFYKVVFDEFDKYSYGKGETLKDFFSGSVSSKDLYPLVSVLSDGEFAAMSYGCFLEVATGAVAKEADFKSYDEVYAEATKEIDSLYLYVGVNKALLSEDSVIAFTDEATRHMAATGELEFFENQTLGEAAWETGVNVAKGLGVAGLAIMGTARVTIGAAILVSSVVTAVTGSGLQTAAYAGVCKICSIIGGPWTLLITVAVVAVTVLISWLISIIDEEINGKVDWDNEPMPEYLYDVKEVGFRQKSENEGVMTDYIKRPVFSFYEVVRDENGQPADLNARSKDSSQWIGLYVSYDRQGDDAKPIKAKDIKVKTGNGETPEGYKPLTRFGEVIAYDLNQWDDDDDVNGVYVFYKQDEEAPPVDDDITYYISDIQLVRGESDAHCIALLEAAGYTPLNVNLSPTLYEGAWDTPVYTYLGYKVTANPNSAIRDIRVTYGPSKGEIQIGSATYADCGSNGWVTVYTTEIASAGPPILAGSLRVVNKHTDAPEGYEPVNFFSGGPAVSFDIKVYMYGTTHADVKDDMVQQLLYFLPETSFTSGTCYLGGFTYFGVTAAIRNHFDSVFEYEEIDDRDAFIRYMERVMGEKYTFVDIDYMLSDFLLFRSGYERLADVNLLDSVAFFYTYNPYRAIYDIKMTTLENSEFNLVVEGIGYAKWSAVIFDNKRNMRYRETGVSMNGELELNGDFFVSCNPQKDNLYNSETGQMTKIQPLTQDDYICLTDRNHEIHSTFINNKELSYTAVDDEFFGGVPKITNLDSDDHGYANPQNHFTFYVKKTIEERPYVSKVVVADELSIYRGAGGADAGFSRGDITDGMLYKQLAAQGATDFCGQRVSMKQYAPGGFYPEMNALIFGYARSASKGDALTDMFIWVNDFSFDEPQGSIYRGGVRYDLLCEIPYNLTGYEGAPGPGVWLYGTTDSRAGSRIIDFSVSYSPFKTDYETIRTLNDRSPWSELCDIMEKNRSVHFLGWAKELFEDIETFFTVRDYDEEFGFLHRPYYFHIKREGDSIIKQKPYVDKLYLAYCSDNKYLALEELFDQGAEQFIDVDLNMEAGGDYIYLGYSRTAKIDDAITDIKAYHKKNPPESMYYFTYETWKFDLVADLDLNKGASGDYIYLYTTKDGNIPVTDLYVDFNVRAINRSYYKSTSDGYRQEVADFATFMWDSSDYSDLNDGASGEYIYLYYQYACGYKTDGTYKEPKYGVKETEDRDGVDKSYLDPNGKYIAELYVMDKETLRKELNLPFCYNVSERQVHERLREMGATEILPTHISANSRDFGFWNDNKVYIGYSRTNDEDEAINDIAIYTELISYDEPPESLDVNRKGYKLVAEAASDVEKLPSAINLLSIGDGKQMAFPKMYLYVSYSGNQDPITDICIDKSPLLNGWNTARSTNGLDPFVDVQNQAHEHYLLADKDDGDSYDWNLVYTDSLFEWMDDVSEIFDPAEENVTTFYIHTKKYTEKTVEEAKPYIEQVYLAEGDSRHDALTKLIEFSPDGFVDVNLNKDAGGKHVYLAYKRTAKASAALRDLMICEGSEPEKTRRVKVNDERIRYTLASNVDLNTSAGGPYLYLYSSDSSKIGNPIKSIGIVEDVVPTYYVKCGIEKNAVLLVEKDEETNIDKFTDICIDLNKGAGGAYLYMYMLRETAAGHTFTGLDKTTEHKDATCGKNGYHIVSETCTVCKQLIEQKTVLEKTGLHVDADGDGDHRCDVCNRRDITSCVRDDPEEKNVVAPYVDENGNYVDGSYSLVYYCAECGGFLYRDDNIVIPATPENITKYAKETPASIFGEGSVMAICIFAAIGALAAVMVPIIVKKKRNKGDK